MSNILMSNAASIVTVNVVMFNVPIYIVLKLTVFSFGISDSYLNPSLFLDETTPGIYTQSFCIATAAPCKP